MKFIRPLVLRQNYRNFSESLKELCKMNHELIYYIKVLLYRNISAITFSLWWKFHVDMLNVVIVIIRFRMWPFFWDMTLQEIRSSNNSYKYYLTKFTFWSKEKWPGGVIYTHLHFNLSKFKTHNGKNLSSWNTWTQHIKLQTFTITV